MAEHLAGPRLAALLLLAVLAGCAGPDRRLTEDEQSCQTMGHSPGTATFRQCMDDLNERRCALNHGKGGNKHVVTADCGRI